jgi:hypothetical protein
MLSGAIQSSSGVGGAGCVFCSYTRNSERGGIPGPKYNWGAQREGRALLRVLVNNRFYRESLSESLKINSKNKIEGRGNREAPVRRVVPRRGCELRAPISRPNPIRAITVCHHRWLMEARQRSMPKALSARGESRAWL